MPCTPAHSCNPCRAAWSGWWLPGQPLVAVDYAHTPDALDKALQALRPLAQQRGGQLWCVFGCGGDRDASKRPLMGAVAQHHADWVVVTSDNPRSEDPPWPSCTRSCRARLPAKPCGPSPIAPPPSHWHWRGRCADVVLIAGKGHEDYQETAGVRRPFSTTWRRRGSAAPPGEASTWA
jgi:hypothetical protein